MQVTLMLQPVFKGTRSKCQSRLDKLCAYVAQQFDGICDVDGDYVDYNQNDCQFNGRIWLQCDVMHIAKLAQLRQLYARKRVWNVFVILDAETNCATEPQRCEFALLLEGSGIELGEIDEDRVEAVCYKATELDKVLGYIEQVASK